MLKEVLVGCVLTLATASLIAFGLVESGRIPANADAPPGAFETWAASTSLHATLAREAPMQPNPVELTDQNLLEGVRLFARNCAVCHGSGNPASEPSPIAAGLYQKPPQLAKEGVEDDPEGDTFWRVKHGIRLTGMPSFGATLSDRQIWTLALFLKHMDKLPATVQPAWQAVQNWPPDLK